MQAPNLTDPDFEPTDSEIDDILRGAGRLARWQRAMADQGVKVLALGLTPQQMSERADSWAVRNP